MPSSEIAKHMMKTPALLPLILLTLSACSPSPEQGVGSSIAESALIGGWTATEQGKQLVMELRPDHTLSLSESTRQDLIPGRKWRLDQVDHRAYLVWITPDQERQEHERPALARLLGPDRLQLQIATEDGVQPQQFDQHPGEHQLTFERSR